MIKEMGNLVKPINPCGNQVRLKEYPKCKALGLRSIPMIGQYDNNYRFMYPVNIMKTTDMSFLFDIPQTPAAVIGLFLKKNPHAEVDFFLINYNGSMFREHALAIGQQKTRFNMVLHPYIFYDAQKGEEHKTNVHMSLYPSSDPSLSLSEVKEDEFSKLVINHYEMGIMSPKTRQEVHIHNAEGGSMAVSPNNAAFLLNTCLPVVSFYLITVIGVGEYKRLLVCLVTVVFAPDIPLVRALDSVLNRQKLLTHTPILPQIEKKDFDLKLNRIYRVMLVGRCEEYVDNLKKSFSRYIEMISKTNGEITLIEEYIKELGIVLYTDTDNLLKLKNEHKLIGESYLNLFYQFIWQIHRSPKVSNMGQETFKEASLTYKIQYIIKFLGCQIKEMEEISRQHNSMLREFQPAETDYSDFDAKKMNIKLKSPPKGRFGAPAPNEEEKNIGIPNEEFWLKESKETSKTRMVDIPLILLNNKEMTLLQKYRFQPSQEFLFKLGDKIDNPSLLILQRHLETIITQNIDQNQEKFYETFFELPNTLQNTIFYFVWEAKGKPDGIHPNFGRCSYFQINEIQSVYHCSQEEIIELLLSIQDMLTTIDKM